MAVQPTRLGDMRIKNLPLRLQSRAGDSRSKARNATQLRRQRARLFYLILFFSFSSICPLFSAFLSSFLYHHYVIIIFMLLYSESFPFTYLVAITSNSELRDRSQACHWTHPTLEGCVHSTKNLSLDAPDTRGLRPIDPKSLIGGTPHSRVIA